MARSPAGRQKLRSVFSDERSLATTLVTAFVDLYGTEGFTWSPETILLQLEDDLQLEMKQPVFDRLMAGIALLTTDGFYQSVPTFIRICNILSGDTYDPRTWDPADSSEIAWGITEALLLSPPDTDSPDPFSAEIRAYIGKVLDAEGIIDPPDVLKIAVRPSVPVGFSPQEFSDDPAMFTAVYQFEAEKTDAINATVLEGLRELVRQLEELPLQSGDTKNVRLRLTQALAEVP